jgi:hypothetical protein
MQRFISTYTGGIVPVDPMHAFVAFVAFIARFDNAALISVLRIPNQLRRTLTSNA